MLSIQLHIDQRTMGSCNIYGHVTDAFGPAAIALAGSSATQAALADACSLDQQNLETALISRNRNLMAPTRTSALNARRSLLKGRSRCW